MPTPDPPNPPPGGGPPRGIRAELAALLENWIEAADAAEEDRDAEATEVAAVFGFFRRTRAQLLADDAWESRRQQIEKRARALLDDPRRCESLASIVEGLTERLDGELVEFQKAHDREARERASGGARAAALRDARTDLAAGDARIRTVRLAERVDRAILAAVLSLEAQPSDELLSKVEALSVRASHAGESFHLVSRWFEAMERSIDPGLRLTRWNFRGEYTLHADRALHCSSAWITRAHARIRQYQAELADEEAESRQAAVLARIDSTSADNPERWRQLADLKPALRADLAGGTRSPDELRLLLRLSQPSTPVLAAAYSTSVPTEMVQFEWSAPNDGAVARCSFTVGERTDALVVYFFDKKGSFDRTLDGQLVHWLGRSATIENAQARFAIGDLRRTIAPSEVLARVRGLFVGDSPWNAAWESLEAGELEP